MGEYAEYQLAYDMRRGMRYNPGPVKRRPLTHPCPQCGKKCRGADALKAHMKAKKHSSDSEAGK